MIIDGVFECAFGFIIVRLILRVCLRSMWNYLTIPIFVVQGEQNMHRALYVKNEDIWVRIVLKTRMEYIRRCILVFFMLSISYVLDILFFFIYMKHCCCCREVVAKYVGVWHIWLKIVQTKAIEVILPKDVRILHWLTV